MVIRGRAMRTVSIRKQAQRPGSNRSTSTLRAALIGAPSSSPLPARRTDTLQAYPLKSSLPVGVGALALFSISRAHFAPQELQHPSVTCLAS
ncbi:hypothetical protein LMH87_004088 [Akanthomyces muscarius]|uniref:Uncharacterized protein n=1 Tax=Akanthomyces muscarius TaxID=2231603 RepID=A0A9W8Q3E3_AKAMU|nr:hypothetical protein LMH87_004088 [Akanthomyces muscarius]KAJ4145233.1 hypothetical protein LMH87_004088 [Akanthomyces muscarius]